MSRPFDESQPGALRLRALAARLGTDLAPVRVEVRTPILLLDERRQLLPGQRVSIPARSAARLAQQGAVTRL